MRITKTADKKIKIYDEKTKKGVILDLDGYSEEELIEKIEREIEKIERQAKS